MAGNKLDIKLKNLPTSPGVYVFKSRSGVIIYIGKAKNLRNRVRTYFHPGNRMDPKTARLASQIDDFDLVVTDSEIEALILEANLVKEHKPRYNVNLKDDKHFPYIKVTVNEPFPRVLVVRRLQNDGARYFGPYTDSKGMRRTLSFLCRLFKIRSCNLIIPHPKGKPQKVCLDYHIGRCGGPCENLQSEGEYCELVEGVIMFLSGKGRSLIEKLRARMEEYSGNLEFEKAGQMRDRIKALESVQVRQKMDAGQLVNRDIISFAREGRETVAIVMQIREGVLIGRQDFRLTCEPEEEDASVVSGFVQQYYNHQPNLPEEIYLPVALDEGKLIGEWLSGQLGKKVKLINPQRGEKLKLVDLAAANARLLLDELLIQKKGYEERVSKSVQFLKEELHLAESPRSMACVDISNTGAGDAVGSLVYFSNGKPVKSQYRHFKIKLERGQDDFAMLREVVGRYFFRLKKEDKTPPDLLVVDGGKGQLSSVAKELESLGFHQQNIIGLAKRLEEIYLRDKKEPLTLPKSSPGLGLLKRIRDEAHRFAIEYNRKVRGKRAVESLLDSIPGIGPKRRELLLKHFGSVKKIKEASLEELKGLKGVPEGLAMGIYNFLKKK